MARAWRSRGAFLHAETANRAFGRIAARRFGKCGVTMRLNARPAASTRRNARRNARTTRAP
eukprot:8024567-Lingulodinium_polyedra.AAC.1